MPETQTIYRIAKVDTTSDTLTNRGVFALFIPYVWQIQMASSHAMKWGLKAFAWVAGGSCRTI